MSFNTAARAQLKSELATFAGIVLIIAAMGALLLAADYACRRIDAAISGYEAN